MASIRKQMWQRPVLSHFRPPTHSARRFLSIWNFINSFRNASESNHEDLYRYSKGRWLWNEEPRLQERYKRFNVSGLKQLAASIAGKQACVGITKIDEGSSNKTFELSMDDGSVVIARIPHPKIDPPFRMIASEVATMEFVQKVIGIPVPKVLAWDGCQSNEAESEYILMEGAKGTAMWKLWEDMRLQDKLKIVDDIIAIQRKLQSVTFTRLGSIYFASDAFEGCKTLDIAGDIPESSIRYARERFVIGPIARYPYLEDNSSQSSRTDRGPWSDATSFLRAVALRERRKASAHSITDSVKSEDVWQSSQARLSLINKFQAMIPYLSPGDHRLDKATLSHPDLQLPSIFVKEGRVSSIVDWQSAWVNPLFMQERRPHWINYYEELVLRLPYSYETMKDEDEKASLRDKVERSLVYWNYNERTKKRNPILSGIFDLPLASTRRETVVFASHLWDKNVMLLRECLTRLCRRWDELETTDPCPISFTSEEIAAHRELADDFNLSAEFWDRLSPVVGRDGHVMTEDYDRAKEFFAEIRKIAHEQAEGAAELQEIEKWVPLAWMEGTK